MNEVSMNPTVDSDKQTNGPSGRKRRKLRNPRVARACAFCRKRKVRCSGTYPCEYCVREDAVCTYDKRVRTPAPLQHQTRAGSINTDFQLAGNSSTATCSNVSLRPIPRLPDKHNKSGTVSRLSRRSSLEPPQTFLEGQHMGPTAGVSFLYHSWNSDNFTKVHDNETSQVVASLTSHGDFLEGQISPTLMSSALPTVDKAFGLLETYFRFATPTYRFLHRPTLEEWTTQLLNGKRQSVPKSACVLLACAQSLLYTKVGDRYADTSDEELLKSRVYCQRAKTMLDHEPGPATLASVQARLAMCLYLLSTFKINECRFGFSLAIEILKSLGLHRKTSTAQKLSLVESESRKRTFWCAYILDAYLSVMLGRPRLLRDDDVDQPYPENLDDEDMMSSEASDGLPLHGNLEAFIWHAKLAKLMGRNNDLLYPLYPLKEEEVFLRTSEMVEELDHWRDSLPGFLQPREKTLVGQKTFERQNTVLKLAHAHLRILVTRRCLLIDFNKLGRTTSSHIRDARALKPVQECVAGIKTVIGVAYDLVQRGSLYQSFWFTQYIALVAISTLYVFLIQGARDILPAPIDTFQDVDNCFVKAKECQRQLMAIAPDGSQSRRHHKLLDRLRAIVEKDLRKIKRPEISNAGLVDTTSKTQRLSVQEPSIVDRRAKQPQSNEERNGDTALQEQAQVSLASKDLSASTTTPLYMDLEREPNSFGEQSLAEFDLTPTKDDFTFQNMLDWGWESFDTIGFPNNPEWGLEV